MSSTYVARGFCTVRTWHLSSTRRGPRATTRSSVCKNNQTRGSYQKSCAFRITGRNGDNHHPAVFNDFVDSCTANTADWLNFASSGTALVWKCVTSEQMYMYILRNTQLKNFAICDCACVCFGLNAIAAQWDECWFSTNECASITYARSKTFGMTLALTHRHSDTPQAMRLH